LQSALSLARRAPIVPTTIERDLGTVFTVDTLQALRRRYPDKEFVWLMGSDNLAQLHRWRDWRRLARTMPIAVIARPGYDGAAAASPAAAWLGRYRRSAASLKHRAGWSAPALIHLRFDPDPRSASAIRRVDPDWARGFARRPVRDPLTHHPVNPDRP
jgi:nicotinate-nucleotide adenylyltransferase